MDTIPVIDNMAPANKLMPKIKLDILFESREERTTPFGPLYVFRMDHELKRVKEYTLSQKEWQSFYAGTQEPSIKNSDMENANRELTFGERAAGVNFNPSNNPVVDSIKAKFAAIIDELNDERTKVKGDKGEAARYYSKAISYAEDAQMNAVKGATWTN